MKTKIGIITFPMSHEIPLSNLLKLLCEIVDEVYLVTGGAALEKL